MIAQPLLQAEVAIGYSAIGINEPTDNPLEGSPCFLPAKTRVPVITRGSRIIRGQDLLILMGLCPAELVLHAQERSVLLVRAQVSER